MSDADWNQSVASMMKSWNEAQMALWESWVKMSSSPTSSKSLNQEELDITEQWTQLARQNIEAWSDASAPIAKTTSEQFIASQAMALRFVEFSTRAWTAAAPKVDAGEDWSAAMSESLQELRESWIQSPATIAGLAQDNEALWRLYMDQWRGFGQPWESIFMGAPAYYSRAISGDSTASVEFSDAFRLAYNQTFGRLVSSPNLGLTREFNHKLQASFDAWVAWYLANLEYQAVMDETWDKAFKKLNDDLIEIAERGEKIESVRELILLWTRGSEKIFTDTFRSEKYVLSQGKLLNTSMKYRIYQRELIEEYLKVFDLPTRTELDDAYRRIYEMNKEIKALKKVVAQLSAPTDNTGTKMPVNRKTKRKSTARKPTSQEKPDNTKEGGDK
jgi:class III poly(R)-hydroxyalkanoic acid synthase PhaE subunit